MPIMYQIVLFCLAYWATKNPAEAKPTNVKIQSVYSGQFLDPTPPFYFGTDDSVTWQIDWEAGISKSTNIRKLFPNSTGPGYEWKRIDVLNMNSIFLAELNPTDNSGDWIITSNYSTALGRYYHKFRSNSTWAPNHCLSTPFMIPGMAPSNLSPCNPDDRRHEFLISYVE